MTDQVLIRLTDGKRRQEIQGHRVAFSAWQCFGHDRVAKHPDLLAALGADLLTRAGLVIYGNPEFITALLTVTPALQDHALAILKGQPMPDGSALPEGLPPFKLEEIPAEAKVVFHAEISAFRRAQLERRLGGWVEVLGPEHARQVSPTLIPDQAWSPVQRNIYPIPIPEVLIEAGLEMLLIDCPARNLALMPNGLGYVHNALKRAGVHFQTFDLDIVAYHRFHMHRLFDIGGTVTLADGRDMPVDPWQAEHYDLWNEGPVVDYFRPLIEEAAQAIIAARPKVLGLSIQECNEALSRELVQRVKAALPDIVVLVGGFSCYNADVGLRAFPEADYMCIGEADLTVGPLVEALARGECPRGVPGVLSRYDSPGRRFIPAPMPQDLDKLDFPRYEWFDLSIYRNFNGYQLTPVIASRGCRWSRCTFCAERFYWRIRSAKNFVDELEWLANQGCSLFMFNESDLNGMPEKVLDICNEIIRRDIKVKLTGQLRIHKKSDRAFYQKLHDAGFVALRFGVDAFSANTLRLQKKGYTTDMISQNLKDCWECGIFTEVNWVIGVPGETDADTEEGIELILKNRNYIGRLANINPLILINGSVYWIDPEAHGIHFRLPRDELYAKYPRVIPAEHWYSEGPYIDGHVRKQRFERIVRALIAAEFPVGPWAQRIIEAVETDLDGAGGIKIRRTGDVEAATVAPIRTVESHRIYRRGDRFLGVPAALGEVDVATLEAGRDGVIDAATEAELNAAIRLATEWANSRGHFDPRKRQRAFGGYMRAGSFLGEEQLGAAPEHPVIFSFKGETYAMPATERGLIPRKRNLTLRQLWDDYADSLPASARNELFAVLTEERKHSRGSRARLLMRPLVLKALAKGAIAGLRARSAKRNQRPSSGVTVGGATWMIRSVITVGAVPELLQTIGNYNLVQFDGEFYGLPHGLDVNWTTGEVGFLPGVIVGGSARSVLDRIRDAVAPKQFADVEVPRHGSGPAGDISQKPVQLGELEGYRLVSYEGWIYGLPRSLGDIDLVEVDALELPEVVRDVSRDVVEHVILERVGVLQRDLAGGK